MTPSRRDFLTLGFGAFVIAGVPIAFRRGAGLVRRGVPVMGTVAELAVLSRDERKAQAALDAAIDRLRFVDRAMSRFRAESDIGRANARASREPVAVRPETREVLESALAWAERSGGAFDPCLGRAVELWNVGRRDTPPPREEFSRLADRRLHRSLGLDGDRVVFRESDVGLDLGGIAKGYGVDLAVAVLRAAGISDAIVNVGGDLYAMGRSPDGDAWRVGVRSPFSPDAILKKIPISDEAVATSGDYVRAFTYQGRRYHHLLDPRTGAPASMGHRSVTVAAPRCIDADAAATALFGLDDDRGRALLATTPIRLLHSA